MCGGEKGMIRRYDDDYGDVDLEKEQVLICEKIIDAVIW